ncbi:hypothetical protein [Chryseolinea sp. H1M3-3]|uniref:hypothetical protein n=1 Tax=Chryseolinea sp. H1M3-3 TaxID=3034144 RepID=UPI0023EC727D|nr:hypothetical protein [Chryseolinea sp. H1M3-3]
MKARTRSFLTYLSLLILFACQSEENHPLDTGQVTFSFSPTTRDNGKGNETKAPAYVLLSFKNSDGVSQENIKLALFDFGQGYLSDKLELPAGKYQLNGFAVLDITNKIVYAAPTEDSDMAKYVAHPLPIPFTVNDENTFITPQVLEVFEDDKPEIFGYVIFGFEVIQNNLVRKVTLDGIGVQDSLSFYYDNGKISTVNWCTHIKGASSTDGCTVGYSELRSYNDVGHLSSISGRWDLSYIYENGLRKKILTYHDDQYFSTTTFLEYAGTYPKRLNVEEKETTADVELTFNTDGNLIRQTIKKQGTLLADFQIEYTSIINPLYKKMEALSYAVEFSGFNNFVFYYSQHLPATITNAAPTQPGHPVLISHIQYNYTVDNSGRFISGKAFSKQNNVHNIIISYVK